VPLAALPPHLEVQRRAGREPPRTPTTAWALLLATEGGRRRNGGLMDLVLGWWEPS
jgi:hypothetical protein